MHPWNLRRLALVPALLSAWLASSPAAAQTMVLPAPQDSTEVRELRVAFSSFPGRTASWVQLRLYGAADEVFVVLPAPAGARVDVASDAWFEALSATTNPRVRPPQGDPPACTGKPAPAAGTMEIVGSDAHQSTSAPTPGSSVMTLSQLLVWAGGEGLSIAGDLAASLADLEVAGHSFVVVRFEPAAVDSLTKTVRVSPSSASGFVPLLLSRAGASRISVNAWVLSAGRAVPEGLPAKAVDTSNLKWSVVDQSASNYTKLRDQLLSAAAGEAWVVDAASHSTLFFHTPLPGGTGMVPSLAGAYYERASGYGDAPDTYAVCTGKFATLESSARKVAPACGRGDLASVGTAACEEIVSEYETDPEFVRCGKAADDLAIALSGAVPAQVWLTRWTSWLEPGKSRAREAFHATPGAAAVGPLFTASTWESECSGDAGGDSGKGGSSNNTGGAGGSNGGWSGSGGVSGYTGQYGGQGGYYGGYGNSTGNPGQGGYGDGDHDDGYYDDGYYGDTSVGVQVNGSCSSSSSSSGDSCSGDSSDSSSGGDGCSSDTSDSGGDSCGGDSSGDEAESCSGDSSGSEADSCSGDSSSGGGESCSGSSSSGGGAESCSGSSSGGSSDCSVAGGAKAGRRRPPLSGLTMGLVAVMLPLRRLFRTRERKQAKATEES